MNSEEQVKTDAAINATGRGLTRNVNVNWMDLGSYHGSQFSKMENRETASARKAGQQ